MTCIAENACKCRHLEAPDRFRAVQTYRAAMAIMAQQRQFIHKMYNSGVLSDAEKLLMEEVCFQLDSYLHSTAHEVQGLQMLWLIVC